MKDVTKKHNKVKPTAKHRSTFEHIKRGLKLRDAMLAAGFSDKTATHPKQNFIEREGVKTLIDQYREYLIKNGLSLDMLAEIQVEGLFDDNAAIRLGYLKETKKDMGLDNSTPDIGVQVNQLIITKKDDYGI